MSRAWRWEGAVVAIAAGDAFYEAASIESDVTRALVRLGDCVRLRNERGREMLAVVTALWEARDGTKSVEVRQLFPALMLTRQLQEAHPDDLPPAVETPLAGAEKVWESNHLEVVPLSWVETTVCAKDLFELEALVRTGGSTNADGDVAFAIVGFFDVHTDRLARLPPNTTRRDRSRQCSVRAREITTDGANESVAVGQKRARAAVSNGKGHVAPATLSPETEAAIAKLRAACQELLLSHAPDQTTAREDEFDAIHDLLEQAIRTGASSGALYISGLPGTGKTSIVREVVRELQKECSIEGLPPFVYTEINGLHLPKPEVAYEPIWRAVTGATDVPRSLGPARICQMLASEFEHGSASQRPTVLLVLDEMDFLVTGKSVVLYNILEWQAMSQSKLIVVGIANTMDLPERLEQKVRSRLGSNRLIFSSYTSHQLERIVRQRLAKLNIFSPEAIQICCKHVAHASGDARQALTLCRRAAEVAIERLSQTAPAAVPSRSAGGGALLLSDRVVVTSEDMQTAQAATSVSAPLIRLRDCRKFECVFLIALRMEIKRTDREDAPFESVLDRFAVLCNTHSLTPVPRLRDLLLICDELSRSGILRQSKAKASRFPKLMLRCSPQEIYDVFLAHPIGRQLLT